MKWNKRIAVLCLCLVVMFSVSVPRKSYAFAGTLTVASLALTLIAAAGVTYVGASSGDITAAVNEFLNKNPEQKTFLENLITNGKVGQQIILTSALLKQFKDGFLSFFNAVRNFFTADTSAAEPDEDGSVGTITLPSVKGWNLSFDNVRPLSDFYQAETVVNSPFVVFVCFALNHDTGRATCAVHVGAFRDDCSNASQCGFWYAGYGFNGPNVVDDNSPVFENVTFSCDTVPVRSPSTKETFGYKTTANFSNMAFVSSSGETFVYNNYPDSVVYVGSPFRSRLYPALPEFACCNSFKYSQTHIVTGVKYVYCESFNAFFFDGVTYSDQEVINAINSGKIDISSFIPTTFTPVNSVTSAKTLSYGYSFPSDITYEDVVGKWTDALDGETDVVINGLTAGETMTDAGYNLAYGTDTLAPAVEGVIEPVDVPVDIPVDPNLPVTPDFTGVVGLLQSILASIKSLPKSIAKAVVGDGKLDFSPLSNVDISSVFPFCIPFDLYHSFQVFNVPAVEPVFRFDFSGTAMGSVGVIEFDFTEFEPLFKIIRFFTYGGFVVSLVLVTRRLIKG